MEEEYFKLPEGVVITIREEYDHVMFTRGEGLSKRWLVNCGGELSWEVLDEVEFESIPFGEAPFDIWFDDEDCLDHLGRPFIQDWKTARKTLGA